MSLPSCLTVWLHGVFINNFLHEKALKATKQKEEKREKPKPEEQVARRVFCFRSFFGMFVRLYQLLLLTRMDIGRS
jgi:hypothetical protein